jgi:hypothetical protein
MIGRASAHFEGVVAGRKLGEGAFAGATGLLVAVDESKEPRKVLAVGLTREPGRAKPKA